MPGYDQRITNSTNTPLSGRFSRTGKAVSNSGNTSSAATQVQGRAQGVNFSRGQFVRGEVIDLRGHEIKIQLPDSHVLTGNIDDAVQLAIGEQATFRVTQANGSLVSLKLVTDPRAASTELTIDKALDAAGLPRSERNVSMVRALLDEGLSVDKNTIQLMLRQSANLRGVSFHTLAILHKQGLPMNEVNARALDSYLNYEHRIMQLAERTVGEFTDTLFALIEAGNTAEAEILNSELLHMLFDSDGIPGGDTANSTPNLPSGLSSLSALLGLKDILPKDPASLPNLPAADLPLSSLTLLTQEEALTLADTLEQAGLPREICAAVANGSATLREVVQQLLSLADNLLQGSNPLPGQDGSGEYPVGMGNLDEIAANTAGEVPISSTDAPDATLSPDNTAQNMAENTAVPPEPGQNGIASLFRSLLQSAGNLFGGNNAARAASSPPESTPLSVILPEAAALLPPSLQTAEIFTLLNQFSTLCLNRSELGAILPRAKRLELSNLLKDKLSASAREELEDGEITVEKLLSLLLEAEDGDEDSGASSYLASESYQEILKQMLKDRFSLRPETLLKKDGVADFYQRLDRDLSFIEKLPSRSVDAPAFQDTAAGIRENIDFMKALNQLFPYVQLPIKLSGKNTHAELYVYTNRRTTAKANSTPSVLLHLDMKHIGPMDIHLSLAETLVTARFYLPDAISASLTTDNIPDFAAMLKNKGYTLDARVEKRDRAADPVRDMLSPETGGTSMKRYSFDIRA
ncbi:MAG: flagellar hook-length control protein FliK [Lachnospiraceae bacterium]|nr:flagellar hook-length control protein FliK [Lachnospiraceae bacterium]